MKKLFCGLMALFIFSTCACSTVDNTAKDENAFTLFMQAVCNEEYTEAYSFLSSKVIPEPNATVDEQTGEIMVNVGSSSSEASSGNKNVISAAEFEKKYQSVFNLLGVKSVSYNIISETATDTKKTISYTMAYDTDSAGILEYEYTATILLEGGVWKVQWSPSLILPEMSWGDTLVRARLSARRGDITSDGGVLAQTVNLVTVYAVPSKIIDVSTICAYLLSSSAAVTQEQAEQMAVEYQTDFSKLKTLCPNEIFTLYEGLGSLLGMDAEALDKAFDTEYNDFVMLQQFYPGEVSTEEYSRLEEIPGIFVDTENYGSARQYPFGDLLAHTLGYVGPASESDVQRLNEGRDKNDGLYTTDSYVGRSGIERLYETQLRGKDGYYFFIRSADGTNKKTIYRKEKEDGLDVKLTIDLALQQRTEELLNLVMHGTDTAGAVVVMNPKTGNIDAMASYPTFDLNMFTQGISDEDYTALLEQANNPLYNRLTQGLYPPGSTFKAFTAAAALDLNILNANYVFPGKIDNDYWTPTGYGAWHWPAIKRTRVFNRTEPMNMTNSMLHSDNIYFANAALKTGIESFTNYIYGLGINQQMPFELSVSKSQLVNEGNVLNYKLLADSGYGQGELLVSPLQLTTMFCAFRNNGDVPNPHITEGLYATAGTDYSCVEATERGTWIEGAISTSAIQTITPMLQGVVDPNKNGTGRSLRVTNCDVAGKTGSAEIGSDKSRIISWFVGFRLNVAEGDERVVLVMLEIPDSSGYTSMKFHIARELLKLDDSVDPNLPPQE